MPVHIENNEQVIEALFAAGAVGFNHGKVLHFKQGVLSPGAYINNRALPSHTKSWQVVCQALADFADIYQRNFVTGEVIASVATGAIPHGSIVAWKMGWPHFIVRTGEKSHGLKGRIDGDMAVLKGKSVLLIEDMSSTFLSSIEAIELLATYSAQVTRVQVINTWGFPEFYRNSDPYRVYALCDGKAIVRYALKKGDIDESYAALLHHWIEDPYDESWVNNDWILPE